MAMRSFQKLLEGYEKCLVIDLQKNRKDMLFVNIFAVLIAVAMAVPMHFYIPFSTFFTGLENLGAYLIRMFVLLAMMFAYLFLHELVHGAAMKLCGTKKVRYGFCGMYAYAGSEDYYSRGAYIFIALAPVVLFLAVFAVVNLLVPLSWFWTIYLLQIINVSGAAGDIYVTCRFLRMPKDILIKDVGTSMEAYQK